MRESKASEAAAERLSFSTIAALGCFALGLSVLLCWTVLKAQAPRENRLKIFNVKVEPLRQGKNSVLIDLENSAAADQTFAAAIQTRSPRYGRGMGWGTTFFETIEAQKTRMVRFVFKIIGPITDDTWIRFRFYNPATRGAVDPKMFFQENKYSAGDLPRAEREPDVWGGSQREAAARAEQAFRELQGAIEKKDYARAWTFFTKDYQDAEFFGKLDVFEQAMNETPPLSFYTWDRREFLKLKFEAVGRRGDWLIMKAGESGDSWTFVLTAAQGCDTLSIDWIEGFTPRVVLQANWQERLLPKMKMRRTAQFDIYYFPDSAADKDMDAISAQREKGFDLIREFLGLASAERIRLVLFEDGRTKHYETGHQGMGWAFDQTMVEVYNDAQKLDPYHELVHILASRIGDPPAVFNEGLAVYLSERLGASALEQLGGGKSTILQRLAEIRKQGRLIGLEELLTFREIGSEESRPDIAYPEAAAFVLFLVERYGKEKLLEVYRRLKDPASKADLDQNARTLVEIYGKTPAQLENDWLKTP